MRTRQQKSDVVRSKKNEDEKKAGLARDVRLCSVFKKTRMKIGGTPKLRSFILPYLFWFTTCLWMEMQIKADACNESMNKLCYSAAIQYIQWHVLISY